EVRQLTQVCTLTTPLYPYSLLVYTHPRFFILCTNLTIHKPSPIIPEIRTVKVIITRYPFFTIMHGLLHSHPIPRLNIPYISSENGNSLLISSINAFGYS